MNNVILFVIIFWLGINLSMIIRETLEWKHGLIAMCFLVYKEYPSDRRVLTVLLTIFAPAFIITMSLYYIGFRIHIFRETSRMMKEFIDVMYYQQVDLWDGATGLEKLYRKMILRRVVRNTVLELYAKW